MVPDPWERHKLVPLPPLEAIATFMTLMQIQAAVDLAMGRDPLERWRRAKAEDRRATHRP
jgi:hypothetical protein